MRITSFSTVKAPEMLFSFRGQSEISDKFKCNAGAWQLDLRVLIYGASFLVRSQAGEGSTPGGEKGGGEFEKKQNQGKERKTHQRMWFMRLPWNRTELIWTLEMTTCTSVAWGGGFYR